MQNEWRCSGNIESGSEPQGIRRTRMRAPLTQDALAREYALAEHGEVHHIDVHGTDFRACAASIAELADGGHLQNRESARDSENDAAGAQILAECSLIPQR